MDNRALDGNAIGGLLREVFGTEMTAAAGTCAACGTTSPVAQAVVYLNAPGTVVRCPHCEAVLMVFTRAGGRGCADLRGLAWLSAG